MWTTDNNHGAQLQFHTGRHVLEGQFPTIGAWVHYGLGSLNEAVGASFSIPVGSIGMCALSCKSPAVAPVCARTRARLRRSRTRAAPSGRRC